MSDTTRRTTRLLSHAAAVCCLRSFAATIGPEMEQVFAEQRAEAARHGDKMSVWRLWWETAKGIFTTAPREHLSMLRQDSSFALRMMRKNLGFTIAAIVVLGLGIGANTAIFSVVNAVLLKPLPYEHGERLLHAGQGTPRCGAWAQRSSVPELNDYRRQNRSLDGLSNTTTCNSSCWAAANRSAWKPVSCPGIFSIFSGSSPSPAGCSSPTTRSPARRAVLLLSYEYWLRSFGGDPTVVGKTFRMNDKASHGHRCAAAVSAIPAGKRRLHAVVGVPLPLRPADDRQPPRTHAASVRADETWHQTRASRSGPLHGRGLDATRISQRLSGRRRPESRGHAAEKELTRDAKPTMLFLLVRPDSYCYRLRQRGQSQSGPHGAARARIRSCARPWGQAACACSANC